GWSPKIGNFTQITYYGVDGTEIAFIDTEGHVPLDQTGWFNLMEMVDAQSTGGEYSIDNAVNWLNDNAHRSWKDAEGKCGIYVRYGLEAGFGLKKDALKGKTVDQTGKAIGTAKTMGPYLEELGFIAVNTTNYLKGDIAVIQGYPGGTSNAYGITYGHAQMYNGNIWISDFYQLRDFWPGGGYRTHQPSFVIYRWGGN
ncbi:MAG TPA: hypothetical protein VK982_02875, partial [Bacteroidales bacterium]|nr:hypothetical protein [Bacteroidales bacterium]